MQQHLPTLLPLLDYAYIDAGTGSQVIQIMIASAFGVLFAVKLSFGKIKAILKRILGKISGNKSKIDDGK